MKIGTITFHRCCNFGGILQCFALVEYLRKEGYDAEVVDYRCKGIERSYSPIRDFRYFGWKQCVYTALHCVERYKHRKLFEEFRTKYLPISNKTFFSKEDFDRDYDFCLIGSDQVWSNSISFGIDPIFWGDFSEKIKKVSYAASRATLQTFTSEELERVKILLKRFYRISVREKSLQALVKEWIGLDVPVVADPTLLLKKEDYERVAEMPQEDNFIFHYQMEYTPDDKYFVSKLARQLKCKVVTILGRKEELDGVENVYIKHTSLSPSMFLGYMLKARCIVASSFHGTALSIVFRKDFYFLSNYEVDRPENLLRQIGALDRSKKPTEDIEFTPVNYGMLESKINRYVDFSKDFIKESLM